MKQHSTATNSCLSAIRTIVDRVRRFIFRGYALAEEAKTQSRFPPDVYVMLRRWGWQAGRSVPVKSVPGVHAQALAVLHEFGGLCFKSPGREGERRVVDIFVNDDSGSWTREESDALQRLGLCDIGMIERILPLFIDHGGYVYYLIDESMKPVAESFDDALGILLRGNALPTAPVKGARRFEHVNGTRFVFREVHAEP